MPLPRKIDTGKQRSHRGASRQVRPSETSAKTLAGDPQGHRRERPTLAAHNIEVFAQGSYANRTDVRKASDVDVCVLCTDTQFSDLPKGATRNDVGLVASSYTYSQFKADVHQSPIDYFGSYAVTRGNKAFDVHENTYRVDADVVPCFRHVRYYDDGSGGFGSHKGTELRPDSGGKIINWPTQNYNNGVWKNGETGRRFKAMVRILKRLRLEMAAEGVEAAKPPWSYLFECLVWQVPNENFGCFTLKADLQNVIAHLWNETRFDWQCDQWGEINELKYLFRPSQPWTRQQVHDFLQAAWDYVGF